tara:strand:+ start:3210 stop:3395 length:186 start_codon:yes stop_codon:yes gene_type:complete
MKLLKKTLSILFVSLGVYLMTELLNDKKFFDFSEEETIPRLIISLIVGIINELMVKYRKSP